MMRWPFLSTDPRVVPQPAEQQEAQHQCSDGCNGCEDCTDYDSDADDDCRCRCVMPVGQRLTGRELLTGRCADCGRRLA